MMAMLDSNMIQLANVLFFDESIFTLHSHFNSQNCRYPSEENRHWMRLEHTQYSEIYNVWAEIVGNYIVGTFLLT